jgi:hypothetical protein
MSIIVRKTLIGAEQSYSLRFCLTQYALRKNRLERAITIDV